MLSVCITVKNRAEYLKKTITQLEKLIGIDEIVVSDWCSDDTDFSWYKHKLIKIDDPDFSIGKGKNIAIKNATSDVFLILDADVIVPQKLIDEALDAVANNQVYYPIMWFRFDEKDTGRWCDSSFGNLVISKENFNFYQPFPEWTSYGGEDNVYYWQMRDKAVRRNVEGFIHQIHGHDLRTKYYKYPPSYHDEKYKKGEIK